MTMPRQTHTFAELGLSPAAYDEIATKLREAGYDHAFQDGGAIDMHGIGIIRLGDDTPVPDPFALHFVFDALPGPDGGGRFVEVETPDGNSIGAGTWHKRPDGNVELRVPCPEPEPAPRDTATTAELEELFSMEAGDPPLLSPIATHDGEWRRARDIWQFHKAEGVD